MALVVEVVGDEAARFGHGDALLRHARYLDKAFEQGEQHLRRGVYLPAVFVRVRVVVVYLYGYLLPFAVAFALLAPLRVEVGEHGAPYPLFRLLARQVAQRRGNEPPAQGVVVARVVKPCRRLASVPRCRARSVAPRHPARMDAPWRAHGRIGGKALLRCLLYGLRMHGHR